MTESDLSKMTAQVKSWLTPPAAPYELHAHVRIDGINALIGKDDTPVLLCSDHMVDQLKALS
jgi:hypothetical protein